MKAHTLTLNASFIISAGCLLAGYVMGGYWQVIPVFAGMAIFWIATRKKSPFWAASALLLVLVALAAAGVMLKLTFWMMLAGVSGALVWWDLRHFQESAADIPADESRAVLEGDRLRSLGAVIVIGLLAAILGSSISLRLPFLVMVALALLALAGLMYGLQYSRKGT